MGLKRTVVYYALSEFDMGLHGGSITATGSGYTRKPSRAELDKYFKASGGFPQGFDKTVHWCGLFATYVLRKAGVGVVWQHGKIVDLSGGKDITLVSGSKGIGPGDVAVRDMNTANHHFIVLAEPVKGAITSVDGNYGDIKNPMLFYGRHWKNSVSAVNFYYRIF